MSQSEFRKIPSVDDLLETALFPSEFPRPLRKQVVSVTLNSIRKDLTNGQKCPPEERIVDRIESEARQLHNNRVRPVLNATGVVLHTNLGRAPYSAEAIQSITEVTQGYSSLEIDVSTGDRGGRGLFGERLLCQMTGAEKAGVVNNCSGALVLALKAIAQGGDVLISRGELVQIGGGFRIPDVLEASGSSLREVGTTNKTDLDDYRREVDDEVGMILRVHRSNFDQVGFTASPSDDEMAELAAELDLPFVCDLGSGALWDTSRAEMTEELRPSRVLDAGTDLVTFSGDKLLGGPQAGLFLGRKDLVEVMKQHPFFRALRCGKATLAALESTLVAYAEDREETLPAVGQFLESQDEQKKRVEAVYERIDRPENVSVEPMEGRVGGGSLPRETLPSWGLAFDVKDPETFLSDLRQLDPPVVGRVKQNQVLLNFRTILPGQEDTLVEALAPILRETSTA